VISGAATGSVASNRLSLSDYSAYTMSETPRRSLTEGEVDDEVVEVAQEASNECPNPI
jgi:hypothetical protein